MTLGLLNVMLMHQMRNWFCYSVGFVFDFEIVLCEIVVMDV